MSAGLLADAAVAAGVVAAAAVTAAAGWAVVRLRGPGRGLQAARRALDRGDQAAALALARRYRPAPGAAPRSWHDEQRQLESECLYAAAEAALADRRFVDAVAYYQAVSTLVGLDETEATRRVIEAMLAEARRLSAADPVSPALPELLALILDRQSPCPEASFWLGLYQLRRGDMAAAVAALTVAHDAAPRQVDPAFYLGAVWLREGKTRDALRMLAEANRLAPQCPLIAWQLGQALIQSGGDTLLALRALQKATAPDGLPKYLRTPHRLWAETLPGDSWVRNLAQRAGSQRANYQCPLGLDQVAEVWRRVRLALAEALVACEKADEAVPVLTDLLKGHDGLPVRRGLGLALAQLRRPDEALPHLKKAQSLEKPPTAATTGALAACLAQAGGDRTSNVRRALALIASMNVRADASWARRAGAVFAAALAAGVPVSPAEVAELAAVLVSTDAADATAAAVYDLLAALSPTIMPPDCARLYVRAAQRYSVNLPHDEQLFDAAMSDRPATRQFFASREWDFDAAERLYLGRWAGRHPGTFPTAPGSDYAVAAATALLADARRLAAQGRPEAAHDVARLLLELAPSSGPAHDLLAELAYRRGDRAEVADRLRAWSDKCPSDPLPRARLAAFAAISHRPDQALAAAHQALESVRGPSRVPFLILTARLALAAGKATEATSLLDECLALDPNHPTALVGRAALAWAAGKFPRLIGLADRMAAAQAEDPWFHYLAGAALLLAGRLEAAEESARYAAGEPTTMAEGRHLLALVRDRQGDTAGATALLKDAAVTSGLAAEHALALRGQAAWRDGDYAEALRCWQTLPAAKLKTWNLTPLIGGTSFLAGLQALRAVDAEAAATWFRQATRLGHTDARLETLLTAACTRAGAQSDADRRIALLEQAVEAGGPKPEIVRHLARAYRRDGRLAAARRLLDRVPSGDASLELERGLLFVAEGHLVPAERALAAALEHDPQSAAACVNLVFTKLSLGRLADARDLLPRAEDLTTDPAAKRLMAHLHALAGADPNLSAGWTEDDDRAILECLRSIGRLETAEPLLEALVAIRGPSPTVIQAQSELLPLRAKFRLDRGDPNGARELLELPARRPGAAPVLRNLLGVAGCLRQDFAWAVRQFQAALPPVGDDARVQQNLALVRSWLGDGERAAAHWRRFLELHAAQMPKPPGVADYHRRLAALVQEGLKETVEVVGDRAHARDIAR